MADVPVSCVPGNLIDDLIGDLVRYLGGEVVDFSGYGIDLSHLTDFEQSVLCETRKIRYGSVITYSELARAIGRPKAARAVGNALRKNPALIVIPCHRVVAKGGIGGYVLGVDLKRHLLELEGAASCVSVNAQPLLQTWAF